GQWRVAAIGTPRDTTMPRQHAYRYRQPDSGAVLGLTELVDRAQLPEDHARALGVSDRLRRQLRRFRLFSMHTRHYLRRRAWRYFRKLGKNEPTRYTPAVTELLKQYTDDDAGDGLSLLDNWGLMHILFHHCPAIVAKKSGWKLAPGRKLSELAAAPI